MKTSRVALILLLSVMFVSSTAAQEWTTLFDATGFAAWQMERENGWVIEDNAMKLEDGGYIWTKHTYGDFVLNFEVMVSEECNSGVFFRTGDLEDPVQTGIEMQVIDSAGKENPDKHDSGALYDLMEPSTNTMLPAGEWNLVTITCSGPHITIVMNGEMIIDADLEEWNDAGKNPDGTDNKFHKPLSEFPRSGYIGFQDHGHPVWYRNVMIRRI